MDQQPKAVSEVLMQDFPGDATVGESPNQVPQLKMHDQSELGGRSGDSDGTMSLSEDSEFERCETRAAQSVAVMRDKDKMARVNELRTRFWQAKRSIKSSKSKAEGVKPEVATATTSPTPEARDRLFAIEIFSGCGRLTTALKAVGFDAVA
eukprot:6419153-Karenia_brevis.AAC.1